MEDEINLLDYWRVLMRRKRLIAAVVSLGTLIAIIYALLLPKIYKAEATLLPIGGGQSSGLAAALMGQTGLGGLLGGIGGDSLATPLMAVLESRTLAERAINNLDLKKILFEKLWDKERNAWKVSGKDKVPNLEAAVATLRSMLLIKANAKSNLIQIAGLSKTPEFAARLVNGYIEELANYLVENELTSAKRNRIFIEEQLENNKVQVLETGKELSQFYGNNRISNRDPRLDVTVSISKRSQGLPLPPREKGVSGGNKQVSENLAKLEKEQAQLKKILRETRIVKDVPQQIYLDYLTGYYQLLGQMNALLTQQYEMARINEAKEDISFQVIDWARVPQQRFKPNRRQIVMMAFAMSLFAATFIVFLLEYVQKMRGEGQAVGNGREARG